jgi:hypothetical protein
VSGQEDKKEKKRKETKRTKTDREGESKKKGIAKSSPTGRKVRPIKVTGQGERTRLLSNFH